MMPNWTWAGHDSSVGRHMLDPVVHPSLGGAVSARASLSAHAFPQPTRGQPAGSVRCSAELV